MTLIKCGEEISKTWRRMLMQSRLTNNQENMSLNSADGATRYQINITDPILERY